MKPLERLTRRVPFLPLVLFAGIVVPVLSLTSGTRAAAAGGMTEPVTVKSVNGIAFSEFKGYDAWQLIATSQAGIDGCGTSKVGCTKAILGNPVIRFRETVSR